MPCLKSTNRDCGLACSLMLLRAVGYRGCDYALLRQLCPTTRCGTKHGMCRPSSRTASTCLSTLSHELALPGVFQLLSFVPCNAAYGQSTLRTCFGGSGWTSHLAPCTWARTQHLPTKASTLRTCRCARRRASVSCVFSNERPPPPKEGLVIQCHEGAILAG
jgi:hypothetical protein